MFLVACLRIRLNEARFQISETQSSNQDNNKAL